MQGVKEEKRYNPEKRTENVRKNLEEYA